LTEAPTADELALLRESVRAALRAFYNGSPDDSWPTSWARHWDSLAEQGLWATIEPPDGSLGTAAVVAEELGRALYPGPACEALAATYVTNRLVDSEALLTVADGTPAAAFVSDSDLFVQVQPETLLIVATGSDDLVATTAAEVDVVAAPSLDVTRHVVRLHVEGRPVTALPSADSDLAGSGRPHRRLAQEAGW